MEKEKISVIIPVYNAENYIALCVESILHQTYGNFELLLIIDGATDSSAEICRKLAAEDLRITVVEKENEGVSATRNLGLTLASGEFVCFVDADDRVSEDYLEKLLSAVTKENAQMALCQFAFERADGIHPSGEPEFCAYDWETDSLYDKYISSLFRIGTAGYIMGSSCRSIFLRKMLLDNGITFPPCKLYEDQLFVLEAMAASKRIAAVNEALYYYNNIDAESALRKPYKKGLVASQMIYLENLMALLPKLPITPQERRVIQDRGILGIRKLLLTNAAMHPEPAARKAEIKQIRSSKLFAKRISLPLYWSWLSDQPVKTALAELLIQLRMYGLLRKLRSR